MGFELLVFTKQWLLKHSSDHEKMLGLMQLINRSYDKPRYKYGVITTSRVKNPLTLVEDFGLGKPDYGFCLFVLLGSKSVFDQLEQEDGYVRDFSVPAAPHTVFDNDIKREYEHYFDYDPLTLKPKMTVVGDDMALGPQELARVLGCVGFKTSRPKTEGEADAHRIQLDLTAFTSFLRGRAPKLMDLVLHNILEQEQYSEFLKEQGMIDDGVKEYLVLADCITEHNLVDFYVNRCGFSLTGEADLLIEVAEDGRLKNNPYEDGIMATRDFHISFLKKSHSRK